MDLEKLTKHQIVLLTLLISFVTSIATGIVTVSLMDQAPSGVTKVVNQIVEHTVEKIVPATQGAAAAATTQTTVVVKDDDLAAQSIAKTQKSVIRIVAAGGDELLSRGVILDGKGTALADREALDASGAKSFEAILSSGERVPAVLRSPLATTSLAVVEVAVGTSTGFAAATIANSNKLGLGQSVIRIGGTGADRVASGVVASLPATDAEDLVEASITSATPGALLMTIFGEVIGISTANSTAQGSNFYTIATMPPPHVSAPATSTPSSS